MLFSSKSKEQDANAASTSSVLASSSTGSGAPLASPVKQAEWEANGAAGLGSISSLSPNCTSLKHRYDSCFNLWFKDYLSIGDDQIREQQRQGEASANRPTPTLASTSSKKGSSWFSDTSSNSSSSTGASLISESDVESRKQAIIQRYDRDCGKLFKDYQACVRTAVTERGLDDLIKQARKENPFPFDHERQSDPRPNNPPFPFPAAKD
ncbi:uncharacterized protein UMAG_10993 [Mycosarcoma maydis]|uniref:Mitochondrial distribution and morphology protein 35 n=1 Tax=Mycosarcoma maydis TaxID=5270 RepID=A0A0D1DMC7_MYCMD|nr:uncharacterized protein UMAG_10993 [Ustilago maydis 521]KIS65654.1 hypothetical protein UMAG_10993 [Ustilago maydis 521]|eukprot:XP_011392735.1 hypothetical protein UMAG_10993 [Ustilago maydis 521]